MESEWEGTDFAICSKCKQVIRKDEIKRKMHICWDPREIISEVIMS